MSYIRKKQIDLNPSAADRWTTCTASPKFIFDNWDKIPPQDTTFSQEGTTAHEVAAAMLQNREPNEKDKWLCPVPVTDEMRVHAFHYWDYIAGLAGDNRFTYVEEKFPLWYMEERNAKIDFAVIRNAGLHIVDYKYGEGIVVSPENNLQGAIYARSLIETEFKQAGWNDPRPEWPITIHIFQPRTRDGEASHKWVTDWKTIKDLTDVLASHAAQEILTETNLVFAPSDKACQWCPAKDFCTARPQKLTKELPLAALFMSGSGRVLTEVQLAAVVRHGDAIKKWIDDAQDFALQMMRSGKTIPGFKLVMSRGGNRYWVDEKKVAQYLLEDTILNEEEIWTEPKLVGPAAVEKLIGKGKFPRRVYDLIAKPPGQSVIAPEDDPRENCLKTGADDFVDLDAAIELKDF